MGAEFGLFYGENLYVGADDKQPIIENILYDRDVVCMIADPGVGKSILALQLMFSLTGGHPFLETYEVRRPCNVLYFQTEGDRAETIERIRSMKHQLRLDDSKWAHLNLPGIHLNTPEGLEKFLGYSKQAGMQYDVVIIDPLYTTVKGSMLKDDVATDWVRNMRSIREVYGCAFVVLHHDNKDTHASDGSLIPKNKNAVFGSVFWGAFFNSTFKLHRKGDHHVLVGGKQRSGKIVDGLDLEMVQPHPLHYRQVMGSSYGSSKNTVFEIVRKHGPCGSGQVIKETSLGKATVFRALKALCNEHKLERVGELYTHHVFGGNNEATAGTPHLQPGGSDRQVEHPVA